MGSMLSPIFCLLGYQVVVGIVQFGTKSQGFLRQQLIARQFEDIHDQNCKLGMHQLMQTKSFRGSTKTLRNFVKATFDCLLKTYGFLTPDFWIETRFTKSPYQEHTDLLAKPVSKITSTEDPVIEA